MKKCVAISGGRDTVADFVQGNLTPPPPVKIGLNSRELQICKNLGQIRENICTRKYWRIQYSNNYQTM